MKKITFATTNEAKVKQIAGALAPIGVEVVGITDKSLLPEVVEDGKTAQENAQKKAVAYAHALGTSVLSMDNALYFDELSDDEQPGIHVRRIKGVKGRPSDDELLEHYSQLIRRFGDRTTGRWEFAVCFATPNGEIQEMTIVSPRIFTSVTSPKTVPGYPLESIQIDPDSGHYIAEMGQAEQDLFWQKAIGVPLQMFVQQLN